MRFTRAAKVAAFPLLAMVLVVALIACQGPAGPAGPAATAVTGTQGPAGKNAPDTLQAKAMNTVIFNSTVVVVDEADTNAWVSTVMGADVIDLSMAFTGGADGDRMYRIETVLNTFEGLGYELDNKAGTLTVTVAAATTAENAAGDDTVIRVEVIDADRNDAVANIAVRVNATPMVTDANNPVTLTVGTQPDDNEDADDDGELDDYDTRDDVVTCVRLNTCTVQLAAMDANNQDPMDWKTYTASDLVVVTEDDATGIITIMGVANKSGEATVYAWAEDQGGLPLGRDDVENTAPDESMFPEGARTITVTVDGAPYMSSGAIGSITLTELGGTGARVGHVYDPDADDLAGLIMTYEPLIQPPDGVAEVVIGLPTSDAVPPTPNSRPISVIGRNAGTVMVTVTVTELADANTPTQSTSHEVVVTVSG